MDSEIQEQLVRMGARIGVLELLVAYLLRHAYANLPPAEVQAAKDGLHTLLLNARFKGLDPGQTALVSGESEDALEKVFELMDAIR